MDLEAASSSKGTEAMVSGRHVRLALYRAQDTRLEGLPPTPVDALDMAWVRAGSPSPWAWERAVRAALSVRGGAGDAFAARAEATALLDGARHAARGAPGATLAGALAEIPGASALVILAFSAPVRRVLGHVLLALLVVGLVYELAHRPGGGVEQGRGLPLPGAAAAAGGRSAYTLLTVIGARGPETAPAAPARRQAPTPRARRRAEPTAAATYAPAPVDDAPAVADASPAASPSGAPEDAPLQQSSARSSQDLGVEGASSAAGGSGVATAGGLAYTALLDASPMPFVEIASGQGDLWVSQTEVTEAQWLTVMGLDLSVLLGTVDRPARHLTLCDALRFANGVSEREGFRPVYEVPRDCERGGEPSIRRGGDGFRLMSAEEWQALQEPGLAEAPLIDNESVWAGGANDLGLFGINGGIAEIVWRPGAADADVMGCSAEDPGTCQTRLGANEVDLEVGLRLVRVAPARDRGAAKPLSGR